MSLSFSNYVNCLLMIGLSNNLTIVTQGGTPVKPTFYVLWWGKIFRLLSNIRILFEYPYEYSNIDLGIRCHPYFKQLTVSHFITLLVMINDTTACEFMEDCLEMFLHLQLTQQGILIFQYVQCLSEHFLKLHVCIIFSET